MGTCDIALERVQALLKIDAGNGSLHDHLVQLSRKLAEQKPGEALAQLETLSRDLKQSTFRGQGAPDISIPIVPDAEAENARLQYCDDVLKLSQLPTPAQTIAGVVQDFMKDSAMFKWAGVGFDQQESYLIGASLKRLAMETPSLERLRFWGKILGTEGDYYIAEGMLKSIPKVVDPDAPVVHTPPWSDAFDIEPRGEGANAFTYFVSAGPCQPWQRLPAVRACHILTAQKTKRLLTGKLDAPVLSMPWFPGKERHLLRAQIARISASCTLAVTGWFQPNEENPNIIEEAPEAEFPAQDALATPDAWVHRLNCINRLGKCSYPDVDAITESLGEGGGTAEQTKALKQVSDTQAAEGDLASKAPLSGIGEDLNEVKPEGEENNIAWSFKVFGDKTTYGEKSHQVTSVRSTIWPGATTVAQGNRFANIYIGYATKCSTLLPNKPDSGLPIIENAAPFFPLVPDDIMDEPQDLEEQDEPNPPDNDDGASDQGSVDPEAEGE